MKVRALTNFGTATLSFIEGQEADVKDEALAKELVRAKFVEEVTDEKPAPKTPAKKQTKKAVTDDESERADN